MKNRDSDRYELNVIRPGDKCYLGDVEAKVLEVAIKPMRAVQYRVVWWEGRNRRCEWLEECEVTPISRTCGHMVVGFAAGMECNQ